MVAFVRSLEDALNEGDFAHGLQQVSRRGWPAARYRCPCGAVVEPGRLVDCRSLPSVGQPWACDGCISTWQREGRSVDGGPPPRDSKEWRIRWAQLHGAPQAVIDKLNAMREKEPYVHIERERRNTRRPPSVE